MGCTIFEELMPDIIPNLIKIISLNIRKISVNPALDRLTYRSTQVLFSQSAKYQRQRNCSSSTTKKDKLDTEEQRYK